MSLFPNSRHPHHHRQYSRTVPVQQTRLPEYYKNLNVLCACRDAHQLPLNMEFIGFSTSDKGAPMAVYACPYRGCNWREGYVRDFQTGKPRCLWGKKHHNR